MSVSYDKSVYGSCFETQWTLLVSHIDTVSASIFIDVRRAIVAPAETWRAPP